MIHEAVIKLHNFSIFHQRIQVPNLQVLYFDNAVLGAGDCVAHTYHHISGQISSRPVPASWEFPPDDGEE